MNRSTWVGAGLVLAASLTTASAAAKEYFVTLGASGSGSSADPFGRIGDALEVAMPGDVVTIGRGTYDSLVQTVRAGSEGAPITIRAADGEEVLVRVSGRALRIDHPHHIVKGIAFDGDYGDRVVVDVNAGSVVLRDVEVRHTSRDCVDLGSSANVLIDGALIHHCLRWDGERVDAHGITGGAIRDVTIRDTEIHTFTGDAIQFDPGRNEAVGWDNLLIERCRFWLEPLPATANGVPAGTLPGENALDTKIDASQPRARVTIVDTAAWGFRGGLISNMAAFNLKERVDVVIDGLTVFDAEIALRLRGRANDGGAHVQVANAVIYDVDTAIRYEDDIENLRVWNSTFGLAVGEAFDEAGAGNSVLDVRNLLVLGDSLPIEARNASSNIAADETAFINAQAGDYRLNEGTASIDAGEPIPEVALDRQGAARPQGSSYDVGAYERLLEGEPADPGTVFPRPDPGDPSAPGAGGSSGALTEPDASADHGSGCSTARGGRPWGAVLLLLLLALARRRIVSPARLWHDDV